MSETMPINYHEQAQRNLTKNLELLEQYNSLSKQIQESQIREKKIAIANFSQAGDLNMKLKLSEKPINNLIKLKSELQATGDSMVFGPIDWIMYKNLTKQNMQTLGDLITHCQNGDMICPIRFAFFKSKWNEQYNFDKLDLNLPLLEFINMPEFEQVVCNPEFDSQWWSNELKKDERGNTIKWDVAYKY